MPQNHRDQKAVSTMICAFILVLLVLALTGCATPVPVAAKFPEPPGKLATVPCPQLQKLADDAKLSNVATTVTNNYGTYYECAIKVDTWIEWYNVQKTIFENAGK